MRSKKNFLSASGALIFIMALLFMMVTSCTDKAKAKPNIIVKEPPRPGIVAKIGGKEITEAELIGDDKLDFFELKKREYELRMDRLNKLMVEILVGGEAKKAGMSLEDFINKNVTKGPIKISDKELKDFIAEKHIPESQINPGIKQKIISYLEANKKQELLTAYVSKLTSSNPVEVYFSRPRMEVKVEVGDAPAQGPADAPVTIIEYSDFQCPFCSRGAEIIAQVKKKYKDKVRLAFKHFPLPMHQNAKPAAEASMCVNEQGSDKFWKFHDLAFKHQEKLEKADLEKYAKDSGADMKKFGECLAANKYAGYVQKDMADGEKIGVRSTPTFFINGQIVSGALPIESFSEMIDEELNSKH